MTSIAAIIVTLVIAGLVAVPLHAYYFWKVLERIPHLSQQRKITLLVKKYPGGALGGRGVGDLDGEISRGDRGHRNQRRIGESWSSGSGRQVHTLMGRILSRVFLLGSPCVRVVGQVL